MALHRGKTKTAVLELGLQDLINADRRRRLGEAFGSQPDLWNNGTMKGAFISPRARTGVYDARALRTNYQE